MANGDGGTIASCQLDRAVELTADIGFVGGIVQEYLPLDHLHVCAGGSAGGLAIANGHAVEEIELIAVERLHHFLHARQAGGHGAAHVVIHTHRIGHIIDRIADNALDLFAAHGRL
ncbi:hypothetical protein D3C78_1362990 [compost metagenome]